MALVPCNVCGTLNSEDVEICLSCEHPIKGRKRPAIFQWMAIALVVLIALPVLSGVFSLLKQQKQPRPSQFSQILHHSQ
jgi:predicted nucleic acid-binding Zn ribbon protein